VACDSLITPNSKSASTCFRISFCFSSECLRGGARLHGIPCNLAPLRKHSEEKQIRKQVDALLELGVIKESRATEWSQVHLVPKPTPECQPQKWRFTLDFVRLNSATGGLEGWPIPNIQQIINRRSLVLSILLQGIIRHLCILILRNARLSSLNMDCLIGTE